MEIEVPKKIKVSRNVVSVVVVIVVAIVSFYGGTRYQKSHQPTVATTTSSSSAGGGFGGGFGGGGGGRFGGTRRGIVGSVTAISSTSITIQGTADNASHTYSISSNTMISNNGQTAAASDIATGNNVLVIASPSDASQAARILINPSFGGGTNAPTSNQQD